MSKKKGEFTKLLVFLKRVSLLNPRIRTNFVPFPIEPGKSLEVRCDRGLVNNCSAAAGRAPNWTGRTLVPIISPNYRYRYRLEFRMNSFNCHYRYRRWCPQSPLHFHRFPITILKVIWIHFPQKIPLPLPSWNVFELERQSFRIWRYSENKSEDPPPNF